MTQANIVIVEDEPIVAMDIKRCLKQLGYQVAAVAASSEDAVQQVVDNRPDLVLMDIRMPGMSGLEVTRVIKARHSDTKVVMLTVSDDEQDLFEAVKSGAHGYLLKDLEAADFFDALDVIQRGEAVLPTRLAGKLLDEFRSQSVHVGEAPEDHPLSSREQEILALVAQGLTNREVAEKSFISENTVKFHMKNILDKLHLQNRSQVVAWAARRESGNPPRGR